MFYLAQLLGVVASIFLFTSFQINNKKKLLKFQIFSSLFFLLQYLCLNAYTGCLMNLMTLIRNIVYKKCNDKVPKIYVFIIVLFMIILSVFSYNGLISIFPTLAVIIYSIALSKNNLTTTRVTEVISCSLFLIYNIKVLAISSLIATIIEMIFALLAIYKFDIKKIINRY